MELPGELIERAKAIAGDWTVDTGEEERLARSIAEFALAERLSATERAAKVCEAYDADGMQNTGGYLARAIRSQP